jgi:Polycomb-like MTF2 factor 2
LQTLKQEDEFKLIGGNHQVKGDLVCLRRKQAPQCPKLAITAGETINDSLLTKLNVKSFPIEKSVSKPVKEENKGRRRASKGKRCLNGDIDEVHDDSSDENSSKSALDWIIPPPSNFNGKNNPFHSQYKYNARLKLADRSISNNTLTVFEKLPDIRIVRTIKRRLNAKDIALGLNKEAKRRKLSKRRKSTDIEIISEIIQPISMPLPSYPPVRGHETKEVSRVVSASATTPSIKFEKFKLNEKECENFSSNTQINLTETVINSPVKNNSINLYFGAINRIENGEHFSVIAKRFTFDGKEQYLLEWDCSNGNNSIKKDPAN